jgi:hypothetical protein
LFVYRWPRVLGPQYYPATRHLTERHIPRSPPRKGQRTLGPKPELRNPFKTALKGSVLQVAAAAPKVEVFV